MTQCTRDQKIQLAGLIFALRTANHLVGDAAGEIPEEAYKAAASDAEKIIALFPLKAIEAVFEASRPAPV